MAMTPAEIEQRKVALNGLVQTPGWKFVEEHIEKQIARARDISGIDTNKPDLEIATQVRLAQSRKDTYKSLLHWVDESINKKKEVKSNG